MVIDREKRSELPPWEAPVMIAEKRKIFFSFLEREKINCGSTTLSQYKRDPVLAKCQ